MGKRWDDELDTGWYPSTDGGGRTLEVIDPASNAGLDLPTSWRPSPQDFGTPGADDSIPAAAPGGLQAVAGGDRVTLSWTASPGAAAYRARGAQQPHRRSG